MPLQLSTPVKFIKRIGERIAAGLAERGVSTVEDLLYHLPFRYEDRLHPKPLSMYQPGDMASLLGEVRGTVLLRTRSGPIFEMTVGIKPPGEMTVGIKPPDTSPTHELSSRPESAPFAPTQNLSSRPESAPFADAVERSPHSAGTADNPMEGLLKPPPSQVLETVKCMWFHGAYLKDKFHPGQTIALYGKLEGSRSGNALHAPPGSTRFKMIQPTFEILPDARATGDDAEFTMLEMGRIVPVYESLGGKTPWGAKLTSRWLRRVLWTVFKDLSESEPLQNSVILSEARSAQPKDPPARSNQQASSPHSATRSLPPSAQDETLPTALRERLGLPTRMDALRDLHFPPAGTSMTELMSARTPAHRRLIFEEFWYLELGLELKRRRLRERAGTTFITNDSVREALKQVLPFKPTAAQKRVLGEIVNDMRSKQPMRRLLQGDVGSGKTIVAFQAALVAIENGYQVAMMAPTEILATQHYLAARKLLADKLSPHTGKPYRIALLTGSLDDRTKRETRARIFRGEIDLAIGTHALVEEKVDFANLGLVIVDEQHRFGVQQRFQLMRKPNSGTSTTQTLSSQPQTATQTLASRPQTATQTLSSRPEAATQTLSSRPEAATQTLSSRPEAATQTLSSRPEAAAQTLSSRPQTATQTLSSRPEAAGQTLSSRPEAAGRSGEIPAFRPGLHASSPLSATRSPSPSAQDTEPDVLVMTATPIPRTLALTLYGDLVVSVIDELPPGRTPILTRRMPEERSAEVWDFVRKQVTAGRQAYIVYPIIEGEKDDQPELDFAKFDDAEDPSFDPRHEAVDPSLRFDQRHNADPAAAAAPTALSYHSLGQRPRKAALRNSSRAEGPAPSGPPKKSKASKRNPTRPKLRSATEMHDELQQGPLKGLKLGLLHGRMSADEKEITMARFKRGEIDVLVSTTVIEVGVDVANATVMVIEHADRFGLAQLHQLRGRVGRGAAKSYCVLLTNSTISPEAEQRLDAMVRTQNGFELAELDLQQRGPGEFFGTRQAGLPEFRVANLARDRDLLDLARLEAAHFVEFPDPTMPRAEIDAVWSRLKHQWQRRYGLLEA